MFWMITEIYEDYELYLAWWVVLHMLPIFYELIADKYLMLLQYISWKFNPLDKDVLKYIMLMHNGNI